MTMFLPDMNTQAQTASGTKVLVAYFSHSGNTRAMARQIAEATGGDLFEIVPAAAYPAEYVVPFMTHEGSRMGRSEEDIRKLCAGATLLGGLPLRGGAVKDSRDVVRKWVQGLNLTK